MRVKLLRDHDNRVKPSVVQAFKKGRSYDLPKPTAEKLIAGNFAVSDAKPVSKEK